MDNNSKTYYESKQNTYNTNAGKNNKGMVCTKTPEYCNAC